MADLREQLQTTLGDTLVLEQELGGGGMSRVFVAQESALGRKVVVKVLPPEMAAAVSIDRFRREIQLAAQLQHPHIVPLLSAGETNGLPYFTMPYVRGESLRARLKGGELPVSEAVRVLREVASALAYAHENHIVHRDIKPENVLISGGSAVVTDFGVAKALTVSSGANASSLTSLGVALGTPAYMAPEQATADPNIDHRADIYSLGVMAYEMLSGSTPFQGRSPQATLAAHVTESPELITRRRATIPPGLAAIVMRCLEKHAADRPQTAADVMHELDALSTPSGGMTPTMTMPASRKTAGIRRWVPIGIAAIVLLALAAFGAARWNRNSARVATAAEAPAIAVLPFENVGRAEGKEFTDGITEEITNRLSSLRGLRVIGRQSAKSYAGTTKTPQQIAAELGVMYVLTGTVRWDKSADGKDLVRVTPALLRSDDATQVWGDAYQTVLSGVFEVQAKVATDVANALNVRLLAPEKAALAARPTENVEAYAFYLRANEMIEASIQNSVIRQAIALLEKATAADPQFAVAWSKLAVAHTEYFWFSGDKTSRRLTLAKRAVDRALAIDPELPDAHLALGVWYYHGFRNYTKALAEFAIAERAHPNDYNIHLFKGAIQRRMGQWDQSIQSMRRATELEPRIGQLVLDLANTMVFLNRFDEAEKLADRGMILDPTDPEAYRVKAIVAVERRGNVDEALDVLRRGARSITPHSSFSALLMGASWIGIKDPGLRRVLVDMTYTSDFGTRGDFLLGKARLFQSLGDSIRMRAYADSAVAALREQLKDPSDDGSAYLSLAQVEAMRGNRHAAMQAIEAAAQKFPASVDAFVAPDIDNARASVLTALGDYDAAISVMERQVSIPGGNTRNFLRLNPRFAVLHSNPRFQKLIQGSQ